MLAIGENPGKFEAHALWRCAFGNHVRHRFGGAFSRTSKRHDGRVGSLARGAVRGDRFRQ